VTASNDPRARRGRTAAGIVAVAVALAGLAVLAATTAAAATGPVGATVGPRPLRVMVAGNSVAGTLARGSPLADELHGIAALPGLEVSDRIILACGISSLPEVVPSSGPALNSCGGTGHWQQQWPVDLAEVRPDVVLVGAGDHDVYDEITADGTLVPQGSAAWRAQYSTDVAQMFSVLRATGASVVAISPGCYGQDTLDPTDPPIAQRSDPQRVQAVQAVWREQATRRRGVHFLDLDATICPAGVADPALRPDGVHFSQAGADRLAPVVARALDDAVRLDHRQVSPRG